MSIPALCPRCGLKFTSRMFSFENSTNITIAGCGESCPRCGAIAKIQDGTYDFVGKVLSAIRAPGVMHDDLLAFRNIAQAVQTGVLSNEEAAAEVAKTNSVLANLWRLLNNNGSALAVVITIITLYVAIWTKEAADSGSDQVHQDAQQLIHIQERIYESLQQQHALALPQATPLPPKLPKPSLNPTQKLGSGEFANRKERRAAAAQSRHQPRS